MKMKRFCALFLVTVLCLSMTAGCGKTETPPSESERSDEKTDSSSPAGEPRQISFWHYMSEDKEGKEVNAIVEEYNKSQDRVVVTPQYLPRTELMKQYTIGVVSGDLPDVGQVDNPDHASYASMGVFEDITDLFDSWEEAQFLEGPLNSCIYEGKIYGLPWGNNCLGLFYDVDLLKEANIEPPTTWTELEAACAKLTQGSAKGLAISAIGNEEGTFQLMPWILSAGGTVDDMTSEGSTKALTFLNNLVEKGYLSRECINWTQADVEKQFASGSAAMMINGPWNIPSVQQDAPDKNWAVTCIPKADDGEYASVLGGENIGICAGADVESSWDFMTYLSSKENSAELCYKIGRFSPRSDIDVQEMFKDDPVLAVFASLMPTAQSRGPSPKWPEISSAIYTAEQEILAGQKDVTTALAAAQAKIDKINASLGQ